MRRRKDDLSDTKAKTVEGLELEDENTASERVQEAEEDISLSPARKRSHRVAEKIVDDHIVYCSSNAVRNQILSILGTADETEHAPTNSSSIVFSNIQYPVYAATMDMDTKIYIRSAFVVHDEGRNLEDLVARRSITIAFGNDEDDRVKLAKKLERMLPYINSFQKNNILFFSLSSSNIIWNTVETINDSVQKLKEQSLFSTYTIRDHFFKVSSSSMDYAYSFELFRYKRSLYLLNQSEDALNVIRNHIDLEEDEIKRRILRIQDGEPVHLQVAASLHQMVEEKKSLRIDAFPFCDAFITEYDFNWLLRNDWAADPVPLERTIVIISGTYQYVKMELFEPSDDDDMWTFKRAVNLTMLTNCNRYKANENGLPELYCQLSPEGNDIILHIAGANSNKEVHISLYPLLLYPRQKI